MNDLSDEAAKEFMTRINPIYGRMMNHPEHHGSFLDAWRECRRRAEAMLEEIKRERDLLLRAAFINGAEFAHDYAGDGDLPISRVEEAFSEWKVEALDADLEEEKAMLEERERKAFEAGIAADWEECGKDIDDLNPEWVDEAFSAYQAAQEKA
jgi:hypothetical protein